MRKNCIIAMLLSLISVFTLICCMAVPALAANPKSTKSKEQSPMTMLKKEDFTFYNSQGQVVAQKNFYNTANYVDYVAISMSKGGTALSLYGFTNSAITDSYCDFTYPNLMLNTRQGIGFGSTESEVFSAYGKNTIKKYKYDQTNEICDKTNVPVEYCIYGYYKTGRVYEQEFGFNDEKKLCRIIWYSEPSNGQFN